MVCPVPKLWAKYNPKEVATPMKKLFTLLFTAALAISLAAPVFAQDSSASSTDTAKPAKKEKKAKTHKEKKPKSDSSAPAAPQQ